MSKPQRINTSSKENKDKERYKISEKALKAKLTERLKELASPKEYSNLHIKRNPFGVSKAALKAKVSKRIEELAKAKIQKDKS